MPLPPPLGLPRPGTIAPPALACCTSVVDGERLYVFGGLGPSGLSDALWRFDVSVAAWSLIEPSGDAPAGRAAHSAVLYDGCMYVMGGHGLLRERETMLSDMYRLELAQMKWEPYQVPRAAVEIMMLMNTLISLPLRASPVSQPLISHDLPTSLTGLTATHLT